MCVLVRLELISESRARRLNGKSKSGESSSDFHFINPVCAVCLICRRFCPISLGSCFFISTAAGQTSYVSISLR
jgi:hypothetical protein